MKHAHHYHVVNTGPGCVLPDSTSSYKYQHEAFDALRYERDVQREMLGENERIVGNLKRNKSFAVETDIVGRYRYFVYIEPCNDPECEAYLEDCA